VVEAVAINPTRLVATAIAANTVIGSSQVRGAWATSPPNQLVGEENGIEHRCFGALRQIQVIVDVGQWQRRRSRMAPRRLVMAAAVDEQVEVQVPSHRASPCWCLTPGPRSER
jgi:hypothetical protein